MPSAPGSDAPDAAVSAFSPWMGEGRVAANLSTAVISEWRLFGGRGLLRVEGEFGEKVGFTLCGLGECAGLGVLAEVSAGESYIEKREVE